MFELRDPDALAAGLAHLLADAGLRERLRAATSPRPWSAVADDLEEVYERVAGRRHDGRGDPALRARLQSRPLLDVDLHMHTDHSGDCATPVEVLLKTAREQGLGAIAVTDHNEVSGALEAAGARGGLRGQGDRRPRRSRPPARARSSACSCRRRSRAA